MGSVGPSGIAEKGGKESVICSNVLVAQLLLRLGGGGCSLVGAWPALHNKMGARAIKCNLLVSAFRPSAACKRTADHRNAHTQLHTLESSALNQRVAPNQTGNAMLPSRARIASATVLSRIAIRMHPRQA